MFVEYGNKVYIGRCVEEGKIELYSPFKEAGFERVKTVGYALGKMFSKSKYRKVIPIAVSNRVYDCRFEGRYLGETFALVCMGNVGEEYDYRLDTYFDKFVGKSSIKVILMSTDSSECEGLGFIRESGGIYTKVGRLVVLEAIFLLTHDYYDDCEDIRKISPETFLWHLKSKFRGSSKFRGTW